MSVAYDHVGPWTLDDVLALGEDTHQHIEPRRRGTPDVPRTQRSPDEPFPLTIDPAGLAR
jgi:hypothetical protein